MAQSVTSIDRELAELRAGAKIWASLPARDKAELLERVRGTAASQAGRWAAVASQAKDVAGTQLEGEEWISGPWALLYALNAYIATLKQIDQFGRPQIDPKRVRTRPSGQVIVDAFPNSAYDKLLLNGIRAEVWMEPGVTPASLPSTLGTWYADALHEPRVALVLGAGNISSIAPLDVLYELLADGAACVLKMNPVNEYLGPVLQLALQPLVDGGFLRFVYGGAEVGKYLCNHDLVDEIHITGSDRTYDAIVYGDGPDAAERKRSDQPVLRKPISAELGNVSPTIVVPGPWTDADFRFQAENIVTQKMHNGGFNCVASQVLILPADWAGSAKLLDAVRTVLQAIPDRPAYYPGAGARQARLSENRVAKFYGRDSDGFLPRTLLTVEPSDDEVFRSEAFCSVLAATSLPGDTGSYLTRAVAFSNEKLWGTLGGNLIVHPKTMRGYAAELDAAIADMRQGCVAVNTWTGVGYFIAETPWGAYPGHVRNDIQSGTGVVHNSHFFSRSQKTVVYGPFAPFPRSLAGYGATLMPKPPWFVTNAMAARIGRALCAFETNRNPLTFARVVALALRG